MGRQLSGIVALVETSADGGFGHVYVSFGHFYKYERSAESWRFERVRGGYDEDKKHNELAGLRLSCQFERVESSGEKSSYAWRVEFDAHLAIDWQDTDSADRVIQQAQAVKRAMVKVESVAREYGSPSTFGEWVQRFLIAVGVKEWTVRDRVYAATWSDATPSWDSLPYCFPVRDSREDIDHLISVKRANWATGWNRPVTRGEVLELAAESAA